MSYHYESTKNLLLLKLLYIIDPLYFRIDTEKTYVLVLNWSNSSNWTALGRSNDGRSNDRLSDEYVLTMDILTIGRSNDRTFWRFLDLEKPKLRILYKSIIRQNK